METWPCEQWRVVNLYSACECTDNDRILLFARRIHRISIKSVKRCSVQGITSSGENILLQTYRGATWHSATSAFAFWCCRYLARYRISSAFIHLYCNSHFAHLLLFPVMISLLGLLLAYVAVRASAASPEAPVYVFPQSTQAQSQPPSISPKDARLFFAQQLGVSEYYNIGEAEESTLHLLNAHAGRQRPLFKEGRNGPRRALLILEGVEHPEGHPTKLTY